MTWRQRLAAVKWRELAPVAALVAILVALGAVAVLGNVGRGPEEAGPSVVSPAPPDTQPTVGPSTTMPSSPRPSGSPGSSPGAPTSGSTLDPTSVPTLPGCLAPRRLSVLTFNIHGGRTRHGVDLSAVAREIGAARADVVLLQEVDQNLARTGFRDEPGILAQALGMHVYFRATHRSDAILTRFPVTAWSSTPLPLWPGREERRLVEASVLVEGQLVRVFVTHLDQTYTSLRVAQIQAVKRLMSSYPDGAVILGGDLNSFPGSPVLRIARSYLRDSWPEVGTGPGYTVPALHPHGRIDYVLHNSWLTPRAAQVLPSRASDHRAVRVDFDLWARNGCGT